MGCAAQRGPVLYPNEHLKTVGDDRAQRDIEDCNRLAENYIKSQAGSEAAKGAAGGTSGLIHGTAKETQPSPVHRNFVDRCLREKGYEPIGWK